MNPAGQKRQTETARKHREFLFPAIAVFLTVAFCCPPIFALAQPPTARIENVTDEYWGVKVADQYVFLFQQLK